MAALPGWVDRELARRGVRVVRYGRMKRGRPTNLERRWFFCGWYWHREHDRRVTDGPHGPFPCWSAALAHAAASLGVDRLDAGPNVVPLRPSAARLRSTRAA